MEMFLIAGIAIGFLVGYTILELLILKHYTIAASLIIYPLLDCTITLIRRVKDGVLPWVSRKDYIFSKLQVIDNNNKFYIFKINIIFNFLNLSFILLQLLFGNYFFLCNITATLIAISIYNRNKKLF